MPQNVTQESTKAALSSLSDRRGGFAAKALAEDWDQQSHGALSKRYSRRGEFRLLV